MELIYYVEDDESIRSLVIYALQSAGYEAVGFEKFQELYEALKNKKASLILLDIMLEDKDGIKILKELKSSREYSSIPVIMLSAKDSEIDKVHGLDYGADDYIAKPFGVMELLSRVNAVIRRCSAGGASEVIKINDIIIDYNKRTAMIRENSCELTYKEFELLYYLCRNKNIVITRDKIIEKVWGFDYEGESRTVDMHIKTLRQKLSKYTSTDFIKTIRSVGYKAEEI